MTQNSPPVKNTGTISMLPTVFNDTTQLRSLLDITGDERRIKIREGIQKLFSVRGKLGLAAGQLLWEVKEKEYWRDWQYKGVDGQDKLYESFEKYCENDIGVKKRKADYFLSIYHKFVLHLNIPMEILADVDWTKAATVFPIIDEDNWEAIIDKTKQLSVNDLKTMVDEVQSAGREDESNNNDEDRGKELGRISFNLFPEQLENVEAALDIAKGLCGSDKKGHLLDFICMDFTGGSLDMKGTEGLRSKLQWHLIHLERIFGVKLKVIDDGFDMPVSTSRVVESKPVEKE